MLSDQNGDTRNTNGFICLVNEWKFDRSLRPKLIRQSMFLPPQRVSTFNEPLNFKKPLTFNNPPNFNKPLTFKEPSISL